MSLGLRGPEIPQAGVRSGKCSKFIILGHIAFRYTQEGFDKEGEGTCAVSAAGAVEVDVPALAQPAYD